MASERDRILRSLSPIEREMLRDQINGTVMARGQATWKKGMPLSYWKAAAEKLRIARLIDAAELHQLEAGSYRGPHRPVETGKKRKARGPYKPRRAKVAA